MSIALEKKMRLNENISSSDVRLISHDGKQIGIVPLEQALHMAGDADLDLVEIVPTEKPPVCRIMDYGKFLFEQSKKRHASKKKQKQIHLKEIKIRPGTDNADYEVKLRNAKRFLNQGDKVKVTLRFRGREMAHHELGLKMLNRIERDLNTVSVIEQYPKKEGRQMTMVMLPKK